MSGSSSSLPSSSLMKGPMLWPKECRKSRTRSSWTEADELRLLNAVLKLAKEEDPPGEYVTLYDRIRSSLRGDYTRDQVVDKVKGLKKRFQNAIASSSSSSSSSCSLPSPPSHGNNGPVTAANSHQKILFEICEKIWGNKSEAAAAIAVVDHSNNNGTENGNESDQVEMMIPGTNGADGNAN